MKANFTLHYQAKEEYFK